MKKRAPLVIALLMVLATGSPALAESAALAEPLKTTFHPYSAGLPRYEGITPGLLIDQQNWQIAENLLPVEVLHLVRQGDFTITIQDTTDLPSRDSYIAATAAHFLGVSLDGGYKISQYQGGRPFPVLDPSDPRAGEKAAWNLRYRDVPDTLEMRGVMEGVDNSGSITHTSTGRMRVRYGMDRVGDEENDPQWAARGVRAKASFEALAPSDIEGNIRITTYYDDENQPYDDLSYSPQNRRTRKSYVNLLMRMGGGRFDILQEEQPPFFFTGYLHEYNWTYKGEQGMLMPGFLRADHLTYGGKNDWYPNVPWELRRTVILESTPKGSHPYSKRIFYIDAQTYTPFCVLSYDPQGNFERLSLIIHGNPDFVPGSQGIRLPIPLGATWVNLAKDQANHMTAHEPTFNQDFAPQRFEMMELLRKGK
jgi:hypothetical protein